MWSVSSWLAKEGVDASLRVKLVDSLWELTKYKSLYSDVDGKNTFCVQGRSCIGGQSDGCMMVIMVTAVQCSGNHTIWRSYNGDKLYI